MILAIVDDLLFLSKIQQTAEHVGVVVKSARPADLPKLAIEDTPNALIIDLNHRSGKALEVLRTLKSDTKTKDVAVIGFVSHVQNELIAAAREAGCDLILARSAFASQLPSLMQRFSGTGTGGRTRVILFLPSITLSLSEL
jgi:DNA-binding NarL/FixJ family response regulator